MKEKIRELTQAVPFQPFVIHMADGRKFQINHSDFVFVVPKNQSWIIVVEENEDRLHHLSALLITGIEYASDASVAN